ncbi:Uu.00g074820.m01.CDS01 [Anthostomella pinea]|uniref:Uu.00g074820.m01.CDS01 n=1 Tax=Anthostomella pinea TaxID=933095 RepID=A0AAI8VVI8_9PEZI|nr:Uu.00g074820.m01.CDS01 [Anthostomella pinea]
MPHNTSSSSPAYGSASSSSRRDPSYSSSSRRTSEGQSRTSTYTHTVVPTERFYVTGQSSGKSSASMSRKLDAWDSRWADASRR